MTPAAPAVRPIHGYVGDDLGLRTIETQYHKPAKDGGKSTSGIPWVPSRDYTLLAEQLKRERAEFEGLAQALGRELDQVRAERDLLRAQVENALEPDSDGGVPVLTDKLTDDDLEFHLVDMQMSRGHGLAEGREVHSTARAEHDADHETVDETDLGHVHGPDGRPVR